MRIFGEILDWIDRLFPAFDWRSWALSFISSTLLGLPFIAFLQSAVSPQYWILCGIIACIVIIAMAICIKQFYDWVKKSPLKIRYNRKNNYTGFKEAYIGNGAFSNEDGKMCTHWNLVVEIHNTSNNTIPFVTVNLENSNGQKTRCKNRHTGQFECDINPGDSVFFILGEVVRCDIKEEKITVIATGKNVKPAKQEIVL